jgi:hypothetical protein
VIGKFHLSEFFISGLHGMRAVWLQDGFRHFYPFVERQGLRLLPQSTLLPG